MPCSFQKRNEAGRLLTWLTKLQEVQIEEN